MPLTFTAHMTIHVTLVAVVAPLIALALAGTGADPVRRLPRLLAPLPISLIELIVVWGWHAPALHEAARHQATVFVLEQATFLGAGALLWIAALGGDREQRQARAGSGVAALLLTFMHMTLLGALFAMSGRPLFGHVASSDAASAVADQQLGGVVMLLVGGSVYLAGGLWLTRVALHSGLARAASAPERSR